MQLASRSAEPLHQARVALRRLRSVFSILGRLLSADAGRGLRDGLRDVAGALGQARDLDVLLQRAHTLTLRDRGQTEREAAYDWVEEVLGSGTTRALMLDLVEWVHSNVLADQATHEART